VPQADAIVIGGGIIGVACAEALAQRGLRVTLVERGQIGFGCSFGNAGLLTPCHAFPLPMPGVLRQGMHWLMDPDSPLRIAPRLSWSLASWLLRFAKATNRRQSMRSLAALVELSKFSLDAYMKWDAQSGGCFGFNQNGLAVAVRTDEGMQAAEEEIELVAPLGVRGCTVDRATLCQMAPCVTDDGVRGGAFFHDEAHVEPLATVNYLARRCREEGVQLIENCEVFDFIVVGRRIQAVQTTTHGELTADQFILATGAWSGCIGKSLALRIPMLSGKGYSLTIDPLDPMPAMPVLLLEARVAITPRKDSIRLAGTLELVGLDDSITSRRVHAILTSARKYVRIPAEPRIIQVWRGLRPCLPDGLPIIGRSHRFQNLVLATGHQMLGLQTAPATGRLVADLLSNGSPAFDPEPFRASRF
jgi:D-amino-acid dehydrogenase